MTLTQSLPKPTLMGFPLPTIGHPKLEPETVLTVDDYGMLRPALTGKMKPVWTDPRPASDRKALEEARAKAWVFYYGGIA